MPQIQSLDNVDRDGISSEKKEVLADIPGKSWLYGKGMNIMNYRVYQWARNPVT